MAEVCLRNGPRSNQEAYERVLEHVGEAGITSGRDPFFDDYVRVEDPSGNSLWYFEKIHHRWSDTFSYRVRWFERRYGWHDFSFENNTCDPRQVPAKHFEAFVRVMTPSEEISPSIAVKN
ncbi:MAG: hypothetical protein A3I05_05700 [Deltaproteobacteria bacterium RIFCSPLOWO2_02_FULL_44_10]|nr:MAG: hypothetical protein A3C46_04525 [Deltaproteobacteria bacterium RIFCSPHIGHO2_02_FULL_44_16]OGQ46105.1 MAG: hypothetical protein A3I05_05700 [Deltaproteobacteria bacterium RIFCSPLOWO2_02_FULL_44_10]